MTTNTPYRPTLPNPPSRPMYSPLSPRSSRSAAAWPHRSRPASSPPLHPALVSGATVLAVWAHPDDECYLGGGLMAAAAAGGGRVVNVTATLGEHGTPDPVAMPPARLGPARRIELEAALAALGVHRSVVLGHEDGTLETIDAGVGAGQVAAVLAEVDPDVVLSFGPDGVTGHPDHIAVGRWTEEAVAASARPPVLLQAVAGSRTPPDLIEAMREAGAYFPGYPVPGDPGREVVMALDDALVEVKLAALAAHSSQTDLLRAHLGEASYRRLVATEAYHPANEAARAFVREMAVASAS